MNSTSTRVSPSISVTLATLPTSTPEARTNCPGRSPLTLVNTAEYPVVRSKRTWPNTTMIATVNTNSTSQNDAEFDSCASGSHGLIVYSPNWRPQTYSVNIGWPSSKWLYGATLAPVSITRYGAGHSSRVMVCQQPGRPPGPPWALSRADCPDKRKGWAPPPIVPAPASE